jgi:hypothetical protein
MPPDDLLPLKVVVPLLEVMGEGPATEATARYCTRCAARCSQAVRQSFLRHRRLLNK